MRSSVFAAVLAFVGACFFQSAPVQADQLEFIVESQHPNVVQIEFYSQDYNRSWPGGGSAYNLDDYETKTINLSCRPGEQICYGAWLAGDASVYWGVGHGDKEQCSDCCYSCGGTTEHIVLSP